VISLKTLVRLGLGVETGCTNRWRHTTARHDCRATGTVHLCVGDSGHRGKHVCPCGALRDVA
jgi:hypothetical protein